MFNLQALEVVRGRPLYQYKRAPTDADRRYPSNYAATRCVMIHS